MSKCRSKSKMYRLSGCPYVELSAGNGSGTE
jgi:hypothetical protein